MEQVSHHPPVSAFHIESDDFIFEGCLSIKTLVKISGVHVVTLENSVLTLKSTNDQFEITRPKSSVHNLVFGDMYVWTEGNAVCRNLNTGHQASMFLHPPEKFRAKEYKIEGKVQDPDNKTLFLIKGAWNSHIGYKRPEESDYQNIVTFKARPDNW